MSRRTDTIEAGWFDQLYRDKGDPWGFRTSPYEEAKYRATLAALPGARFGSALEVGCAIGVFTAMLASRCDALVAIDGSETALDQAREACAAWPQVSFACRMVPDAFPSGRFDLIVLSEVLYYLRAPDLDRVAALCRAAQGAAGNAIVICHWLGETDYPLTGQEATERFVAGLVDHGYSHTILNDETYRLDRLVREK